ncbi:MAG: primosomal protein N', partial [Bacteroidetes bacterium]|nr:primosomal protein N' [Bacteroidota bacterium]
MKFVDVALPLPLERQYTYRVPSSESRVDVGHGVVVPFGKRTLTGIVTDVTHEPPEFEAKDIIGTVDEKALLTAEQLQLTKWISEYYLCGWGEA